MMSVHRLGGHRSKKSKIRCRVLATAIQVFPKKWLITVNNKRSNSFQKPLERWNRDIGRQAYPIIHYLVYIHLFFITSILKYKFIIIISNNFRYSGTYQWSLTVPMRCNQDNQREYEERCFRQISQHLLHQNSNSNAECSGMLTSNNFVDIGQRSGNNLCLYKWTIMFYVLKILSSYGHTLLAKI